MFKVVKDKLIESVFCISPIAIIVMILICIFVPSCGISLLCFAISSILLMVGICLFSIGTDMSLMKMGGYIGSHLSKTKKVLLMLICAFLIGTIVTFAEPDLAVLASQIPGLNKWVFILCVAVGVGVFLMLAVIRILLKVKISYILAISYGIILILMFFVPKQFLPIAFDASGVTTGPISVPFIMAFGLGIVAVRSDESNQNDGFGLLAMCSVGPIFAVMLISAILGGNVEVGASATTYQTLSSLGEMNSTFGSQLIGNLKDVAIVLLPIVLFFVVYQVFALKFPWRNLIRLGIGILYTFVGIVLFFTGVNTGYLPIGNILAMNISSSTNWWLIVPIALVLGLFIAVAEPAVHVLNKQVEDLSSGVITKKMMLITMSIGVSLSIVLSVIRIIFEINIIYFYFPLVLLAVILTFFIPPHMSSIAFDSGGVASGSLSSSFILPFMQGICLARGIDLMTYGFGSIGLIVLTPIIIVELMGVKMARNEKKIYSFQKHYDRKTKKIAIIEFD